MLEMLMWFTLDYKHLMFIRGTGAFFFFFQYFRFGTTSICHEEGIRIMWTRIEEGFMVENAILKKKMPKGLCT